MSLSLPPHLPGYASTSASSSSSSSRKSSDRRKSSPDDKADLKSIDSGSTTLTSRSNTLKLAIPPDEDKSAKGVRRARCPPEYLEEIAKTGVPHGFKTRAESKFKVISGLEADALFEQFVGELGAGGYGKFHRHLSHPVVFAISLIEAGRKVVDYYMTWRGKIPRVRRRRDRQLGFLDSEFRRVARSLDKHYRSIISIVDNSSPRSEPARFPDAPKRHEPPPPKPPPAQEEPPTSPNAVSATASVVSLPLLNMIRNVPFGNRQPLRVTNPDTDSILSDTIADTPAAAFPRILATIAEAAETTTVVPLTKSPTSVGSPSQTDVGVSPKERHRSKSVKESPKNPHDANRRHSSHRHKRDEEPKHRSDDDDSRKRNSKRHDKDKGKDEDGDSDVASEFTIVLLDDKAEKDVLSWHGLNRTDVNATPRSGITLDSPWTGPLVNANKIIFHTPPWPADHYSLTDDESEDEEEDAYEYEYEWQGNSPVIPRQKSLGTQYASPVQPIPLGLAYAGSSVSNYTANSSAPTLVGRPGSARPPMYRTAYTYPVHRSSSAASSTSSSYVPAYIHPRHFVTPDTPLPPPLTQLQTPISYQSASPF